MLAHPEQATSTRAQGPNEIGPFMRTAKSDLMNGPGYAQALRSASALSVLSQVNSGSVRPKWP